MRLTPDIQDALNRLVEKYGSKAAVARRCGIHPSMIGRYLEGQATVSDDNAEKIRRLLVSENLWQPSTGADRTIDNSPELRLYLQEGMLEQGMRHSELARVANMKPETLRRLLKGELTSWFPDNLAKVMSELHLPFGKAPITPAEQALLDPVFGDGAIPTRPTWVFTLAQAASFESLSGVVEPESAWDCEVRPMIGEGRDLIGFRVEGQSMEPRINDGDLVLCDRNQEPRNGQIVVAKLDDTVVCKIYRRYGETIVLESLNPNGKTFEVSPDAIGWMVRAIKVESEL